MSQSLGFDRVRVSLGLLLCVLSCVLAACAQEVAPAPKQRAVVAKTTAALQAPSAVEPAQPTVLWSGRQQAITVRPDNANTVISGANNGGLWRSTDAAQANWTMLNLPAFAIHDVRYMPSNSNIVIATAAVDTRLRDQSGGTAENGGGIWRSTDGGTTWARPANAMPPCATPQAGYGIAFGVNNVGASQMVYVGTDCGLAVSSDQGATFSYTTIVAGLTIPVISVVANGATVDVHTIDGVGHYRSVDFGATFARMCTDNVNNTNPMMGPDGMCDQGLPPALANFEEVASHSLARAFAGDVLFAAAFDPVAGRHMAYESDDQGATWIQLNPPAEPSPGNRLPFVRTYLDASANLVVYYGDGQGVSSLVCNQTTGTLCNTAATWTAIPLAHADASDVAMHPTSGCPLFMASDGGASKSTDCGATWAMVGTGPNGIKALEIYEMTGQVHPGMPPLQTDLYFATQDNDVWASIDSGANWPGRIGAEGVALQVTHSSPTRTGVTVTGISCGGCNRFRSDAGFAAGFLDWIDPPNPSCPDVNQDGACDACVNPVTIILFGIPFTICDSPAGPGTCTMNNQCTAPATCVGGACGLDVVNNQTGRAGTDMVLDGPVVCLDFDMNGVCDGRPCIDRQNIVAVSGADGRCDRQAAGEAALGPRVIEENVYAQWDEGGASTHRTGAAAGALGGACNAAFPFCNAGLGCYGDVCATTLGNTLWLTTNANVATPTWTSTGASFAVNDARQALTDNGQIAGPAANPSLFQPVFASTMGDGNTEPTVIEVEGVRSGAAVVNTSHFATLSCASNSPAMFRGSYYAVAADPRDADNILGINLDLCAAGVATARPFITDDGGATWTQVPQLATLLSGGAIGGPTPTAEYSHWSQSTRGVGFSQATAIAYDPVNSDRILVGTQNAGIIGTLDGGETWARLCMSDQIPRVSSFFFDEVENRVYASSYGRGLWRVHPDRQQVPTFTTVPTDPPTVFDCGAVDLGTAAAEDHCEHLAITISNSECGTAPSPCGNFGRGDTDVTWTAEDAAGNRSTVEVTVTVDDTTGPINAMAPPPIVLSRNTDLDFADLDPAGARYAEDGCQGPIDDSQWRTEPVLPGDLPLGPSDVTWYPHDDLDNEGDPVTQRVVVLGGEGDMAGEGFTCELTAEGDLTCFGASGSGRLGDGTYTDRWVPGPVTLSDVTQVSLGRTHACAVKSDGTVWCWGENNDGRLGTGLTFFDSNVPMQVAGLTNVSQVSAGPMHTCAVTQAGDLYCWGENSDGRLGVPGVFFDQSTPVLVSSLASVRQVSAGEAHTCAVLDNGDLYCWGENNDGRLGLNNAPFDVQVPTRVTALSDVAQVSAGAAHTCAVLDNGELYCWGENNDGRLGLGVTLFDEDAPMLVSGIGGVVQVSAALAHTCAVTSVGEVYCWGENSEGRLGIGPTSADAIVPTLVPGISTAVQVSAGPTHTCALLSNLDRICFGDNFFGQLGDGTSSDRVSPVEGAGVCDVQMVEAGKDFGCAVGFDVNTFSSSAYCWGTNAYGQLASGDNASRRGPSEWKHDPTFVLGVSASDEHACAMIADGSVECWGRNTEGRLGDGTLVNRNVATKAFTNSPPPPNASCSYREADGRAYFFCTNDLSWEAARNACRNIVGAPMELVQIDDQTENDLVEAYVSGSTWIGGNDRMMEADWRWVTTGTDSGPPFWTGGAPIVGGTAVAYANWSGAFEPGTQDCARIDTTGAWADATCSLAADYVCEGPITTLPNAVQVSAGATHTCAVTRSVTLGTPDQVKCWGANTDGMLGDGTTTSRTKPTLVNGLPAGIEVVSVGSGDRHTCALVENGANNEVYCWGDGASGRLGRGNTTDSSVPVKVLDLPTDVLQLSVGGMHSCARSATRVFCWGEGDYGRLGRNSQTDANRAVESLVSGASLATLTISAGKEHTCAVMSDRRARCWGRNQGSQIGDGTASNKLVPTLVSGLNDAVDISAGNDHSCAVRDTAGERRSSCWGNNAQGELGTGTLVSSAVPILTGGSSCEVF